MFPHSAHHSKLICMHQKVGDSSPKRKKKVPCSELKGKAKELRREEHAAGVVKDAVGSHTMMSMSDTLS